MHVYKTFRTKEYRSKLEYLQRQHDKVKFNYVKDFKYFFIPTFSWKKFKEKYSSNCADFIGHEIFLQNQ